MTVLNRCPACGGKVEVIDSRNKPLGRYRRRKCAQCKRRFSTIEISFETGRKILALLNTLDAVTSAINRHGTQIETLPSDIRDYVETFSVADIETDETSD